MTRLLIKANPSTTYQLGLTSFGIVAWSLAWLIFSAATAAAQSGAGQTGSTGSATKQDSTDEKPADQWVAMDPTGARASFEMPERPRYVERQFTPVEGQPPIKVRLHIATVYDGKATFVFGYHDLHEQPKNKTEIRSTLDGAVRGSVLNVAGRLGGKVEELNKGTARQFGYSYADKRSGTQYGAVTRVFLVGRRLYQATCSMELAIFDENICGKYLNSVRPRKIESDLPPKPPVK